MKDLKLKKFLRKFPLSDTYIKLYAEDIYGNPFGCIYKGCLKNLNQKYLKYKLDRKYLTTLVIDCFTVGMKVPCLELHIKIDDVILKEN